MMILTCYYLLNLPGIFSHLQPLSGSSQVLGFQVFGKQLRWHRVVRRDLGPRSLSLKTNKRPRSKKKQPRLNCQFGLLVWVFLANLDLHLFWVCVLEKRKKQNVKLDMITKTGWLSKFRLATVFPVLYWKIKLLKECLHVHFGRKTCEQKIGSFFSAPRTKLKEVPTYKCVFTWPCWNSFKDRKMPAFWRTERYAQTGRRFWIFFTGSSPSSSPLTSGCVCQTSPHTHGGKWIVNDTQI